MGNEGSHRRILNRLRCSCIQFVLRRHRNVIGAVGLIPLRERTALNVNGLGLLLGNGVARWADIPKTYGTGARLK
jgi:hypothetical protein